MTNYVELQRVIPIFEKNEKLFEEAAEVAAKLSRLLPEIVARRVDLVRNPPLLLTPGSMEEKYETQDELVKIVQLLALQSALAAAFPQRRRRIKTRKYIGWGFLVAILFRGYKVLVGSGSTTRNGPAVRFLVAAMKELGLTLSPAAVENALRRSRWNIG
jgi:hypothetical protein